jgi:hypothetical protein
MMTDGYCSNFSVAVASPDSSVEPISTPMQKLQSAQYPTSSDITNVLNGHEHDMFFSCCDWETAMIQE